MHTKTAERMLRTTRRIGREIDFDPSTAISCSQEQFLSIDKNKARLIPMDRDHLETHGFSAKQTEEDVDCLIDITAIDLSHKIEYTPMHKIRVITRLA